MPLRCWLQPILAAVLAAILAVPASGQSFVNGHWDDRFGDPDEGGRGLLGRADAVAIHPLTGEVYVGGHTVARDNRSRYVARWNGTDWETIGGPSFDVNALAFDQSGNLYAAGRFSEVYQLDDTKFDAANVAMWDGAEWHGLGLGLDGRVMAIAADPATGDIYFGGDWNGGFDHGITADSALTYSPKVIRWDGSQWRPVGKGAAPGFGQGIFALTVDPGTGDLYAGSGLLNRVFNEDSSEVAVEKLARWDGSQWHALPGPATGGINALEFQNGLLYAAGDFTGMGTATGRGLAWWDGSSWATAGEGVTSRAHEVRSLAVNGDDVYLGGHFSEVTDSYGRTRAVRNIALWRGDAETWEALGPGVEDPVRTMVQALTLDGNTLWVGGSLHEAGGRWAHYVSRWTDEPPPYPAAYVDFRVDMRRPMRTVGNDGSRPMVVVYDEDAAGDYLLYDTDGDSVWSVRVPQPIGDEVEYAFAVDYHWNRDGRLDWIYERDGVDGARSLTLSSTAPRLLASVLFDDQSLRAVASGHEEHVAHFFQPGNSDPRDFRVGGKDTHTKVDFEDLDRTTLVGVRWYADDPGGSPPENIAVVAANTYWDFESSPVRAEFTARVTFSYEPLTGVGRPEDLRLLYRPTVQDPWQAVVTEQDHTAQTLSAANRTVLTGQWTVGSVSTENPLTNDPPAALTTPIPPDGSLNVPEMPLLAWEQARHASRYDLYLWPASEAEPVVPTGDGLLRARFKVESVLDQTVEYNWRVNARNINGETAGPVWSFRVGNAPDLVVSDIQTPASAISGNEIGLSWTVTNVGNNGTRASSWQENVYLSEDALLDDNDLLLGQITNGSHLGPGNQYYQTASFAIPLRVRSTNEEQIVEGDFFIITEVDQPNRAIESDEENNVAVSSAAVSVRLPTLPDAVTTGNLRAMPYCPVVVCASRLGCSITHYDPCESLAEEDLSRLTAPYSTGPFGVQYAFAWEGANEGAGVLDATQDLLFFSEDSTLDVNSAIPLASASTFDIAPGEPFQATTIPGIPFGDPVSPGAGLTNLLSQAILNGEAIPDSGFFYVVSDPQNHAYEGAREDNNVWRNPTQTVFRSVPPSDIEAVSLAGPATAESSDSISVTWTVRNNGPSEVIASWWRYAVYLSTDQTLDPEQDELLEIFPHANSLGSRLQPDAESTLTEKVRLPDGIGGTYYLLVQFDSDGNINEQINQEVYLDNNLIASEAVEISLADYPDLLVSDLQAPGVAAAGSSLLISYTATNVGAGTAASDWRDGVFLSRSPTWPVESGRFHREHIDDDLAGGEAYQRDISLRLPEHLPAGTYYLYVVVDGDSVVYEHQEGETNNVRRSEALSVGAAPIADLVVENVTTPQNATSGADVTASWSVRNQGSVRTSATSWTDVVYLSTDPQLDANDAEIGRVLHTGLLDPGDQYEATLTAPLPEDFSGVRYIIVRNNETGSVSDAVPSNNTAVSDQSLEVSLGPMPDLRIANVDVSGTPTAGQPLRISVTIANDGAAIAAGKTWADTWTFAPSSERSSEGLTLATRMVTGPLEAGTTYTHDVEVMLPVYAAGSYYLTTEANAQRSIGEAGLRENNVDNQIVTVELPPPVDLVVRNVQVPASAGPGETVTVSYDLVNQGDNPAQGVLFDGIFVSQDGAFDSEDPQLGVRRRDVNLASGAAMKMQLSMQVPQFGMARSFPGAAKSDSSRASYTETVSPLDSNAEVEDDLPALLPGEYHAVVWTDLRNNIRESDDGNNRGASTERMTVDVPELTFGIVESATSFAGRRSYYKMRATEGKDLRLTLESLTTDRLPEEFEIYVAFERAPTPSDFDHAFLAQSAAEMPTVLVPATRPGTYYVMVRNPHLSEADGGSDFSLLAEAFDFALLGITPDAGGNSGHLVATVSGAQFSASTEFYLENGAVRIDGALLTLSSPMQAEVRFDLRGQPLGRYDVVAEQPDGQIARLPQRFAVETPVTDRLRYAFSSPPALFARAPASFEVTVTNENNIDHDVVVLTLLVPGDHTFSVESEGFEGAFMLPSGLSVSEDLLPASGLPLGAVLESGAAADVGVITVIAKNVRIGETLTARLRTPNVAGPIGSEIILGARAKAYSENELLDLIRQKAHEVARVMRRTIAADETDAFGEPATKTQFLKGLDEMLAMSSQDLISAYRQTGLFGDGPLTSVHGKPVYIGETEKNLSKVGASGFDDYMSVAAARTPYSVAILAGDATCSNLATAAGFGLTVGGLVYGAGILVGAAVGALTVSSALVFSAALAVAGGVIFTVITLDSVINDRDWGLTGTLGGVPTSPTLSGIASAFATPLINILCSGISGAYDPNDILGPAGVGDAKWVRRDEVLRYKIRFENDPELANAPARTVLLRQRLDEDLDLRTVRLDRFGFGDFEFQIAGSRAYYETRLDLRDSLGVYVDVNAGLDIQGRELFFRFQSIDPRTGEPSMDPGRGFLPPNQNPPEGDGFISYHIRPRPNTETGNRIDAKADIFFDNNPAIATPAIFNTIDADLPQSNIADADVTELDSTSVLLAWGGRDPDPGSGLRRYRLYVSVEDGDFSPLDETLVDTSYVLEGRSGTRYGFFVTAEDLAGNLEPLKGRAEAHVSVGVEDLVTTELPKRFALHQNYPNPFNPATMIAFDIARESEVRIAVYDILGRRVLVVRDEHMAAGRYEQRIDMSRFASGVYFYQITARAEDGTRFHSVKKFVLVR